jgi:hypothetical protein
MLLLLLPSDMYSDNTNKIATFKSITQSHVYACLNKS